MRRSADEFVVVRRSGVGTQEIAVSGPVVLDVAARREEETKPGMRVVLAARKSHRKHFHLTSLTEVNAPLKLRDITIRKRLFPMFMTVQKMSMVRLRS